MNTRTEAKTTEPTRAERATANPGPAPAAGSAGRGGVKLLGLVAQREVLTQLRRSEFWGSLIIMVLVVAVSIGAQSVFTGGGSDFRVAVVHAPGNADLGAALAERPAADGGRLILLPWPSDGVAEAAVRAEEADLAVLADGSAVYLDRLPPALGEALRVAAGTASTRAALAARGLEPAAIAEVLARGEPRLRALDPDANRAVQRMVIALIGILSMFMLMFAFGQTIAQGVQEEKNSRVVEVLLAKVRASQLLAGKVLGLGVVVLVQILVLVVSGFVAALCLDLIAVPADAAEVGLLVLLWFIPGYFLFATLWAVAGALVSRPEDINNAAGPVSALMTVGLLGCLFPYSGMAPEAGDLLSMVPGFSWSMMPMRMAAGPVPWWQVAVAVVLLALAVAALLRVAGRIYVGGMLSGGGASRRGPRCAPPRKAGWHERVIGSGTPGRSGCGWAGTWSTAGGAPAC